MPKKIITPQTLLIALEEIDRWSGKLTWELFSQHLAKVLGEKAISRHTLLSYPELVDAFKQRKKSIKVEKENQPVRSDVTLEGAMERIGELEAKNARLVRENERLKEQFVRWQYNLYMMPGVDMFSLSQQLDKPLSQIDRRG
ncbi:hypothetical protein [Halomonas denitrificans]|uniref:hypothetical protein n=1 Tax=Halomonas denitrificans TaxID=370769 RepID=UPI000D387572|nr:hypothetical protein [Halomonas denitrificans]